MTNTKLDIQRTKFISKGQLSLCRCNNIPHLNCIDIYDTLLVIILDISMYTFNFLHFMSQIKHQQNVLKKYARNFILTLVL